MSKKDVETNPTDSSALKDLADLLAVRSHSEKEIRNKLLRRHSESAVDNAIRIAQNKNWLESTEELSERVARQLMAKGKGHAFIAEYLESKGLTAPARDSSAEIEKARELIKSKLAKAGSFDYDLSDGEKRKLFRFLAGRGFDEETILQALHLDGLDFSDSADGD